MRSRAGRGPPRTTSAASATCRSTVAHRGLPVQETTLRSCGDGCARRQGDGSSNRRLFARLSPLIFLALPLPAVHSLLPPDVHHDMAAQQEHLPDLQAQVGVPNGAQTRARHPRESTRGRGLQRRQPAAGRGCRRGLTLPPRHFTLKDCGAAIDRSAESQRDTTRRCIVERCTVCGVSTALWRVYRVCVRVCPAAFEHTVPNQLL